VTTNNNQPSELWTEECPTKFDIGNLYGQHSGVGLGHQFRWVDGKNNAVSEWTKCTTCVDFAGDDDYISYVAGLTGITK